MAPKKLVSIIALVAVIAIAGYFAIFRSGGKAKPDIPAEKVRGFQCVNKACGKSFAEDELNLDEAGPYGDTGVMGVKCPACGQYSVFATTKCPACGEVYVPTQAYLGPKGDLKCPKCGKLPPRK